VLATLAGKLTARRKNCAPLVGKSTLNRLEHGPSAPSRYHKIGHAPVAIEGLFVDLFLEAHRTPPREIILDLDATDDPLHGHQEGRFFHGYYDCYCYLPLYVFSGRHLLAAKLRRSNIDASAGALDEVTRIIGQIAYVLLDALRRIGLRHTQLAVATCGTSRLKLLKSGAQVRKSVRRIKIAMASACPHQAEYHLAYLYLRRAAF
jgi:Transposase DDE domain group 1